MRIGAAGMNVPRHLFVVVAQLTATSPVLGQDATVVITEDALNSYAMAVGTVTGSTPVQISVGLPDLCAMFGGGDPTGTLNCPPPPPPIVIATGTLNWSIQLPRFAVASN